MRNPTNYQFEAVRDEDGEYVCKSFVEIPRTSEKQRQGEHTSKAQASNNTNSSHYYQQAHDFNFIDDLFSQSYQSNIDPRNTSYVDNMRTQFEQMRRSMLDQMEDFTLIKNIRL